MTPTGPAITRRRLVTAAGAAAMLPLIPASVAMAQATPNASPIPVDIDIDSSAIREMVGGIIEAKGIPGAIVSIQLPGGNRVDTSVGVADVEASAPIAVNSHFRAGSITKTMTATLMLQLVGSGAIGLDDIVGDLLPDLQYADRITIRQLLSMSSGLFDFLDDPSVFGQIVQDPLGPWTPQEFIALSNAQPLVFEPGTDISYSNTNYIALGLIIEALTGQKIEHALKLRVFQPLRMMNTSLPTTPDLPVPFARGYLDGRLLSGEQATPVSGPATPVDYTALEPSVAWAAGGVVSTVVDLQTWLHELMTGSLIGEALQAERVAFVDPSGSPEPATYGLGIDRFDDIVGHDGSILGYQSFIGRSPSGVSVVAMVNLEPTADFNGVANEIALACFELIGG